MSADNREILGRALLYPVTVAILEVLSDKTTVERWRTSSIKNLRAAIAGDIPPVGGPADILIERIVLWLRPTRRATRPTRFASLYIPLDVVDAAAIIDVTVPYPLWVLTALTETPQFCSSKFPTLGRSAA